MVRQVRSSRDNLSGEQAAGHDVLAAPSEPPGPCRVVVLGTSGSGKSTLASELAAREGVRHIELDGLAHGPNWTPVQDEEFHRQLDELSRPPGWVFDGNYIDRADRILWTRAHVIVWLDLPLRVILIRLLRRTVWRIVSRKQLWNGNRETWRALVGRNSVLMWAIKSHRRYARQFPDRLASLRQEGKTVVRLRSAAEARRWLDQWPSRSRE
jgi:adenylate kinase family enzyme